jgi:hypothetical protein
MSKPNAGTAIMDDRGDDGLETVQDDVPQWIKWNEPPMTVDLEATSFTADGGRDVDQRPCPELEGTLLQSTDGLEVGTVVRVTAGQVKLARLLTRAKPQPGQRVVIKFLGVVKVGGGTMKDFKVLLGSIDPPY